jgi:hypothetical protein
MSESVIAIQISVYPVREEPDRQIVRMAPWVSRTTTIHEVPTKSNLGPCSRDEVLAPSDRPARPLS